jgi:outer membrane protein assembly factor BamB
MKKTLHLAVAVCVAAVTLPAMAAAPAGCATTWHGTGGDWPVMGGNDAQTGYQAAEHKLDKTTVGNLKFRWSSGSTAASTGDTSGVVSGSCFYISGGGLIYAYDASTGRLVWKSAHPLPYGGGISGGGQPQAVSVYNGVVYAASDNFGKPVAAAVDARSGEPLWLSDPLSLGYQAAQQSSPKVVNGILVLFSTGPDFDPHGRPGFSLIDVKTGHALSKRTMIPEALLKRGYSGGGVWATAAVDPRNNYVYAGTSNPYTKNKESAYDNAIVKIDVDRHRKTFGQVVKTFKGVPESLAPALYGTPACGGALPSAAGHGQEACGQQDADFGAGPTLFTRNGHHYLVELQKSGDLHMLDTDSMTAKWRVTIGGNNNLTATGGNASLVAYDGKRIYATANPGNLFALDPDTGAIDWVVPAQGFFIPYNPVVAGNGIVYTVAGLAPSVIVAHDAETGQPVASFIPMADEGRDCHSYSLQGLTLAHNMLFYNCGDHVVAYGLPS